MTCGSAETKLHVLSRHKGMASSVNVARGSLYLKKAKHMFRGAGAVCLQWDEANHSSLNILLGTILDQRNNVGAYMRPTVPSTNLNKAQNA